MALVESKQQVDNRVSPRYFVKVYYDDSDASFPQVQAFLQLDDTGTPVGSSNPLPVSIISGGGGGTQYDEGDTAATITGTAAMMEVAADALAPIQGTVADGLLVNLGTNNDVTLATLPDTASGDLAAIAAVDFATETTLGTLLTGSTFSAVDFALESGGNLDTIAGDTTSIDGKITACNTGAVVVSSSALPSGAATAANQTTLIARLPAVATAADNVTNPSISKIGSYLFGFDGTTWDRLRGDSTNGLLVNLGANNDVTLATLPDTSGGDLAAINSALSGTLTIAGTVTQSTHDNLNANANLQVADTDISDSNPAPTQQTPRAWDSISAATVSVNDSSTTLAASNANRLWVRIVSLTNATIYVREDGSAATTAWHPLTSKGSSIVIHGFVSTAAITAIHAVSGQTRDVNVIEASVT